MDQLKKLFASLSLGQKIGLAAVILLVCGGVPMFTHWQHDRNFKPLFTGMAAEDAGAIVQKLKEGGIEHRLADNGTSILVPEEKVDEVRLEMAGAGLPKAGRIGFELFDKTNLGLTDFGERVNYRRAVEGELERTIKAIDGIEMARVHVTFPKDSVFLDSREPAKASVLVHLKPGVHLVAQNVVAISNLVASAVEGLTPDGVSVVDMQGNLLTKQHRASLDSSDAPEATLDYKHQVEKDLSSKVEATLDPLLGEGKFRIGISADCDFSTSEQTDEVYDPTRSVMATSQKTEDQSQSGALGGVPGTASNLPRSSIKAQAGPGQGNGVSRKTENSTFQTSRTVREVKVPRGTVKRISAALLLDQDVQWQGSGKQRQRIFTAPSAEKLKTIHDLVAGVLGIQPDRGDQLVVETLPFEQTRNLEDTVDISAGKPPAAAKPLMKQLMEDKRVLIGVGVALLFVVLLLVFRLTRKPKVTAVQMSEQAVILPGSKAHEIEEHKKGEGEGQLSASAAENLKQVEAANNEAMKALEEMPAFQLPAMNNRSKALLDHLKTTIIKDPTMAVNVIRGWLDEQ